MFQSCVPYKHKFIFIKFFKMTYHEVSSEENFSSEFYADTFSYCLSSIFTSVSEDVSCSEYSSDSYNGTIRATKRQKTLVTVF